jgi:hypothetical protein
METIAPRKRGRNKSQEKARFVVELDKIRSKLPKNYGVLIQNIDPKIDRIKLFNVKNYGYVDWYLLDLMKQIIRP